MRGAATAARKPTRDYDSGPGRRLSRRYGSAGRGCRYRSGNPRIDTHRAGETGTDVQRHDLNIEPGARRLQHHVVAQVDGDVRDVRGRRGVGVVEEQVAWLQ